MKAAICTGYGNPEVIHIKEVPKPSPKENEVLIRVHAAVVTSADCSFRKGEPFIIKILYGLKRPRNTIPGVEFAGVIEAVGEKVTTFKAGDNVFGMSPNTFGAHAEYICISEILPVALKPATRSFEEAASLCDGATTALTFLRDIAGIQGGQKILINGASGAVGTFAVQLAKHYGAEVTGVCSTTNLDLIASLGADKVIDYSKEDFTKGDNRYDLIFDAVGKNSFNRCKKLLASPGVYLSTVPTPAILLQMLWTSMIGDKKAKFVPAGIMQKKDNLTFLGELYEAGKIRSIIDRRYTLQEIVEAHRYVERGHKRGNVVITFD